VVRDYAGYPVEQDVWDCDFSADGYRLPTEAEWEYAARAVSSGSYCFGEGTSRLHDYAWMANNSDSRTWPGGLKLPNAWGLFDMHGNVLEWCWDFEAAYPSEAVSDPTGPAKRESRMLRGGAFGVGPLGCRSAFRYCHYPDYRSTGHGIRVCCGSH
jgi:formylglycine-generating enzyme required for sulfatase activity